LKEAVAAAVSRTNTCPYCVDAHQLVFTATSPAHAPPTLEDPTQIPDPRTRAVVEWALATRSPASPILRTPPFSLAEAPELLGRVVVFQYFNRMVNTLLSPSPLTDVPLLQLPWVGRVARLFILATISRAARRSTIAGAALEFVPGVLQLPNELAWATGDSSLARALAAFDQTARQVGEKALPEEVRALVADRVARWHGEDPSLSRRWVEDAMAGLGARLRPAARLALLTALASYQVDEQIVEEFREQTPGDRHLLGALAWASWLAALRVGSWLWPQNEIREVSPAQLGALGERSRQLDPIRASIDGPEVC
jgi:alkylhydroperoxidase family enzyme